MNEGMENLMQLSCMGMLGDMVSAISAERYDDAIGLIPEVREYINELYDSQNCVYGHPNNDMMRGGYVPEQCVMSDSAVVVMAHSTLGTGMLMFDMQFDGLNIPVKLVLNVNDAISMMEVLKEFIGKGCD